MTTPVPTPVRLALLPALALIATALPAAAVMAREVPPAPAKAGEQRLVPLEGGQNFRDLGGYRTADGHRVKWGMLYRSGAMNRLTPADFQYLASIGLKTVVDFRGSGERKSAPVVWPEASKPVVFARDYELANASLMAPLVKKGLTGDEARAVMAQLYRDIPTAFADQYRLLFAELLAGHAPLAFNCSAGKDRTGVAAAILLSVLGVDRETAVQDYLLSNQYFKPATALDSRDPHAAAMQGLSPDVLKALMGVDRRYIETAFATIDAYPGGANAYYREKLGLDAAAIAQLRGMYLTKA
ncbi:tyrosine-protein phosphatase [Sphingobium sufflavum]|uniref:tyrosine-protein phosphatase n=1 Tax=Sphingobium sufflavum TaxID=1129547 RepID=UPI001F2780A1|nr:tyrosine-protein phosphatase [Sphingobium sufflavum]MCE7795585.1 tyrosine-protein phosphatase [Sphingobium sufflavum]